MAPYFLVLSAAFVTAAFADRVSRTVAYGPNERRAKTIFDWLPYGILAIFLGSRLNVGTDYYLYELLYNKVRPDQWSYSMQESPQEVGYILLQLLSRSAGLEFNDFLLVVATLTLAPVLIALRRIGAPTAIGVSVYVLLGVYLASFNIVRQSMAMSLILCAVAFLPRRGLFLALAILASLVHVTAAPIAVLLYVLRDLRPSNKLLASVFGVGILAAGAYASVPYFAQAVIALNPRYGDYLGAESSGIGTYAILAFHGGLILLLLRYVDRLDVVGRRCVAFAILGMPFLLIGTQSVVVGRIELYFAIFLAPAIAIAWRHFNFSVRACVAASLLGYFALYLSSFGDLVPYSTTLF